MVPDPQNESPFVDSPGHIGFGFCVTTANVG
jgi:hypothetical protein